MSDSTSEPITISPIGWVRSSRSEAIDDYWGGTTATIALDEREFDRTALDGLQDFSHVQIIYLFHKVAPAHIVTAAEHPRENKSWPKVGIFAQRKKNRPNRLGLSTCRLLRVDGLTLIVAELDAIDGTPVVDIKPYVREFEPRREDVRQPSWIGELMANYFDERP